MLQKPLSRRTFLASASTAALAHAASSKERLKAGLVGCGGRGTQAAVNLLTGNPNVDLVAMADVFEDALESSLNKLRTDAKYVSHDAADMRMSPEDLAKSIQSRIKIDPEHHFVGFDAYKKIAGSDIDIVMLTTPPGYRPGTRSAGVLSRISADR